MRWCRGTEAVIWLPWLTFRPCCFALAFSFLSSPACAGIEDPAVGSHQSTCLLIPPALTSVRIISKQEIVFNSSLHTQDIFLSLASYFNTPAPGPYGNLGIGRTGVTSLQMRTIRCRERTGTVSQIHSKFSTLIVTVPMTLQLPSSL